MHRNESLNCLIITSYQIFWTIRRIQVFKKQFLKNNIFNSQVLNKQNVIVDQKPPKLVIANVTPIMVQTFTVFKESVI